MIGVEQNIIAAACSIIGCFFTTIGLISMKLANIFHETNPSIQVWKFWNFWAGLLFLAIS